MNSDGLEPAPVDNLTDWRNETDLHEQSLWHTFGHMVRMPYTAGWNNTSEGQLLTEPGTTPSSIHYVFTTD
jgi:hypothetical protein